ncbi:MAG: glycosyltransferase [Scytolyngbya sp. HA4215-MV1]|jgi:glycosyltransferase involved in cell wall biosynthesis|nr:glycosyltransferase [Scytolyngbya sp. HA4215-MV1]
MQPSVSILIPCYNAEQWIAQAIESALAQTYSEQEVIVVDDGSSDRSLNIIQSFGDQIRWATQPNQGGNATRNRLLAMSSGSWIQYLDADDYLLPHKIERQVQYLAQVPAADIIYGPSRFEYYHEKAVWQEILSIPNPHDPWILLVRWYLPQTGSPLWRKQAIVDVGGWKTDQPCCQEHELYFRLLMARKRFEYLNDASSVYRQWSESTVCKKNKAETYRRRLEITDNAEVYLKENKQLTPMRQQSIHQSRFECARQIWLFEPAWAIAIMTQVHQIEPNFLPTGNAAPANYQWFYRKLGFATAETIANFKRSISPPRSLSRLF